MLDQNITFFSGFSDHMEALAKPSSNVTFSRANTPLPNCLILSDRKKETEHYS